jgi:hypothetical protein
VTQRRRTHARRSTSRNLNGVLAESKSDAALLDLVWYVEQTQGHIIKKIRTDFFPTPTAFEQPTGWQKADYLHGCGASCTGSSVRHYLLVNWQCDLGEDVDVVLLACDAVWMCR